MHTELAHPDVLRDPARALRRSADQHELARGRVHHSGPAVSRLGRVVKGLDAQLADVPRRRGAELRTARDPAHSPGEQQSMPSGSGKIKVGVCVRSACSPHPLAAGNVVRKHRVARPA